MLKYFIWLFVTQLIFGFVLFAAVTVIDSKINVLLSRLAETLANVQVSNTINNKQ